jgi:hypothetical protein
MSACVSLGGNRQYSMRCELDSAAPGPCVLQSPLVGGLTELKFCCIDLQASSDNVIFQLSVMTGDNEPKRRNVTLQAVNNNFSGTACVAIPTASNTFYQVQLSAFSYLTTFSSAERANVLSIYLYSFDIEHYGKPNLFSFQLISFFFNRPPAVTDVQRREKHTALAFLTF